MGWSTELFCNISFNKQTYNYKGEVQAKIDELKKYIKDSENRLRDLVMITEPNKFCPENYDPIIWMRNEFEDEIENLRDCIIELYKLNLLLDSWDDCHDENGHAIKCPENFTWNTAFLEGDYIENE